MPKILLVEDDPMIAEIYLKKFESAGFEVVNAKTGKEVLKYVGQDKFDLVLLDMVLPEMSGMEVLKEIKGSGNYDRNVKVVIFSNLSELQTQNEALENGADGFIGKNQFNPSDLVKEVGRLLNQYAEQDKNRKRENEPKEEKQIKGRVLLVEDEDFFLEMFGKKLEDDGFEVTKSKDGAWAVKEAQKGKFDLVITDIVMSAMGGEEIIEKLKEAEATKNIPIIAISASVAEEKELEIRQMGVAEFFFKTRVVPSDLSRKVEELLEK